MGVWKGCDKGGLTPLFCFGVCAVNSSRLNFGARGYVKADAYSVGCALVYLYAVFQPAGKDVESAGFGGILISVAVNEVCLVAGYGIILDAVRGSRKNKLPHLGASRLM